MEPTFKQLSSTDPKVISQGLEEIYQLVSNKKEPFDLPLLFDAVTSLFYIDTFDRPDLREVVEKAQKTVAVMGPPAIAFILEKLKDTDIKAELAFAQSCGLMGARAIQPLIHVLKDDNRQETHAFALYALGKIKSPEIVAALPYILEVVTRPGKELEDTAVRALGKICESIRPEDLDESTIEAIFDALVKKLSHANDVIRSKAVRSLGKLIRYGFVNPVQRNQIKHLVEHLLGLDEEHRIDPAFLVRREAQEVLDLF